MERRQEKEKRKREEAERRALKKKREKRQPVAAKPPSKAVNGTAGGGSSEHKIRTTAKGGKFGQVCYSLLLIFALRLCVNRKRQKGAKSVCLALQSSRKYRHNSLDLILQLLAVKYIIGCMRGQVNEDELDFELKLHCVDELASRWWYALPPWPPADFDFNDALA